jgi:hypothetical protein
MEQLFEFEKAIQLIPELNCISLLRLMVGLPIIFLPYNRSHCYCFLLPMYSVYHKISIRGLNSDALMELSSNDWGYEF